MIFTRPGRSTARHRRFLRRQSFQAQMAEIEIQILNNPALFGAEHVGTRLIEAEMIGIGCHRRLFAAFLRPEDIGADWRHQGLRRPPCTGIAAFGRRRRGLAIGGHFDNCPGLEQSRAPFFGAGLIQLFFDGDGSAAEKFIDAVIVKAEKLLQFLPHSHQSVTWSYIAAKNQFVGTSHDLALQVIAR